MTDKPKPTSKIEVFSPPPAEVHAEVAERVISGIVLPWNETGQTARGEYIFKAGALDVPSDISRVKLLAGHSPTGVPVGVAVESEARPEGLWMKFKLGSSDAASALLADAYDRIIDRFSIEAVGLQRTGMTVNRALLKAVAMVPFPAFVSARAEEVAAEHAETNNESDALDDNAESNESDAADAEDTTDKKEEPPVTTNKRPAAAPEGLHTPPAETAKFGLDDALTTIMAARNGHVSPDELHAELKDLVGSDTLATVPPQWLDELWSGVVYTRRVVPLIDNKPLTGRKAVGYRWKTKPGVDKWAGDKKDIPSKPAKWETVEIEAQNWAGGNDLDRRIIDFNETHIIRAYWEAMAESYAYETDADTAKFLVDNAMVIDETAPDLIRAISKAAIRVDQNVHTPATFAIVNPEDLESVLDFSQLDVPHYTGLTPVSTPDKWVTSEFVAKGTALVGAKPAATFYELPGSPLRAEAEHIAKGGRDFALFGYTAHLLNRPEALVKVSISKVTNPAVGTR